MTQSITTYSDEWAVVSDSPVHYQSVQTALSETDGRVHVHAGYDAANDDEIVLTERRHLSADHGTIVPPITVETGHKRPPGPKLEGMETPSLTLRGVKFGRFEDVHTSPGGGGIKVLDTADLGANSNRFVGCTIDRPAGNGFTLDPLAHATAIRGCLIVGGKGYGVFANGPASVLVEGGQIEDCVEAGVKLRRTECARVRDVYIEGNGHDASDAKADVTVSDAPRTSITGNYLHGLGGETVAVSLYGDRTSGVVRDNHAIGYANDLVVNNAGDAVTVE